jgi:hypothetical protein
MMIQYSNVCSLHRDNGAVQEFNESSALPAAASQTPTDVIMRQSRPTARSLAPVVGRTSVWAPGLRAFPRDYGHDVKQVDRNLEIEPRTANAV